MEKYIINFICELDDSSNGSNLCYLQKKRYLKYKKRNLILQQVCKTIRRIPKILGYFEVVNQYPDDVFFNHFRMSRSTFQSLLCALEPFWITRSKGRCAYNLEECLLITLWKMSNGCVSFRHISDRFNVGMGLFVCSFVSVKSAIFILRVFYYVCATYATLLHFRTYDACSVAGCCNYECDAQQLQRNTAFPKRPRFTDFELSNQQL
ncbi:uncharacterized protein LOC142235381 [Haematobia irritans]|uniref:uncharacterized protein LOC142235381 n=1 Tax=Haematobia irritans TaxID=7368 RepID=UPI003F507768